MKHMNPNAAYAVNSKGQLVKTEAYDPRTMVLRTLTPDMKATPEQIAALEEASRHPIVFDADCPELTPAMAEAFRKAARIRDMRKNNAS